MKKVTFLAISDGIFTAISVFILSVVILNYFLPRQYSIVFSLAISAVCTTVFIRRRLKKNEMIFLKKTERQLLEQMVNELYLISETKVITLFSKVFEQKNIKYERRRDHIYLPEKNLCVFVKCGIDGTRKKDVVKIFNRIKTENVEIFTTNIQPDVLEFAKRFDGRIKLLGTEKTFKFLQETNLLPKATLPPPTEKPRKELLKSAFTKKKARNYFFLGLGLLIMSGFVTFNLYYVIFGTAFMLFSLACRFFAPIENVDN
jgi:hypothetical protein